MPKKGSVELSISDELRAELDAVVLEGQRPRWDAETMAVLSEYVRKVPTLKVLMEVLKTARPDIGWSMSRVSEGVNEITGHPWLYWKTKNRENSVAGGYQ